MMVAPYLRRRARAMTATMSGRQPAELREPCATVPSARRRAARLWISRARLKQWVPRPCAFCKGGYRTAWSDVLTPPSLEMRSHPIPHSLARAGFVQKIEPVTARSPLFRRLDQPALHWMAMHVTQSLHALVRRAPSVPDGKKKRLKEAGPPAHRFLQRSLQ